jgi:hypothetical protein
MSTSASHGATAQRTVEVPALGLAESAVLRELGLTWGQLQPIYGREIGAPRDYVYRRTGTIFTAEGVRRLVAHFGLPIQVQEDAVLVPLETTTPSIGTTRGGRRHFQGPWYLDFT